MPARRAVCAVRCAGLLPLVGAQCRRGFRPRGRLTFFAGAKKVSQESTWEYNAACGGWRWCRSLRSSRWCARSRAAGARQGHLRQRSGVGANSLGHPRQAFFAAAQFVPHRYARYRAIARDYSERSDARWATGKRVPAFRCPNGLAVRQQQSHSRPCRAPAARDHAYHRPERSDRCQRQPPHAALVSQVFLGLLSLHQQRK